MKALFKLFLCLLSLLEITLIVISIDQNSETKCFYNNCAKLDSNLLNVHLIPHTHDDVGWLKTVDQYYYGTNMNIQNVGVQYILDSVINALTKSTDRRFIWVETSFFWKWWTHQNNETKNLVNNLVQTGQLEFINGGWSMNDEAVTHYNSIIDQMTWGFRRLKDTFGQCGIPKIGWQIDPFGHSREMANIFAQMNFDAFFIGRFDYLDQQKREQDKDLELFWIGSDDLGRSSTIFTSMMDNLYVYPPGFCFDLLCEDDDPIIDDKESEEYNIEERYQQFSDWAIYNFGTKYATNNIMATMGMDFNYQNANQWFKNMDKLIKYNKEKNDTKLNMFYSTPSCYVKAIQSNKLTKTFKLKSDDYLPYGTDVYTYWTGYFSSRPAFKYLERVGNNFLQVCKQLDSLALLNNTDHSITQLRQTMGYLQHHDAVTGTQKQHVANDYVKQLSKGIHSCEDVINKAYNKLMPKGGSVSVLNQQFCKSINESQCEITEKKEPFTLTIYNPIGRLITSNIRLPVSGNAYEVKDPNGKIIETEIIPIPDYVKNIPSRNSNAVNDLLFRASIPALGFSTYFIKLDESKAQTTVKPVLSINNEIAIKSKTLTLYFNQISGELIKIDLNNGQSIQLKQSFNYYKSKEGDNLSTDSRASGAYVFRPIGDSIKLDSKMTAKFIFGSTVTEVQQKWNSWISQTIRVYQSEDYVEFDWIVGPIPINDSNGKEIITRFDTNMTTNATFYTDSNGRQMMKRIRDFRPTFKYEKNFNENISPNYYPINSRIALKDEKEDIQLTLMTDRSQGGSSLKDGSIELMIHRRLLKDDGMGVNETLNETGIDGNGLVVRGKHYMFVSKISNSSKLHRDLGQRLFMSPQLSFANYSNETEYRINYKVSYSGLNKELPHNIHLLTLEQWINGSYLIRLENYYESKENNETASIDLKQLFFPFNIISVNEMTLGSNQLLGERNRLNFETLNQIPDINVIPIGRDYFTVHLKPMQIRTFIVNTSTGVVK